MPNAEAVISDRQPRCWRCNRKLAELVSRPWDIVCTRCKARNKEERLEHDRGDASSDGKLDG